MKLEKSVQSPERIYAFLLWSFAWRAALILGFLLGSRSESSRQDRRDPAACACPPDAAPAPIDAGAVPPDAAPDDGGPPLSR